MIYSNSNEYSKRVLTDVRVCLKKLYASSNSATKIQIYLRHIHNTWVKRIPSYWHVCVYIKWFRIIQTYMHFKPYVLGQFDQYKSGLYLISLSAMRLLVRFLKWVLWINNIFHLQKRINFRFPSCQWLILTIKFLILSNAYEPLLYDFNSYKISYNSNNTYLRKFLL